MKQHSAKKVQKWKERFERERQLRQEIRAVAPDILRSKNFRSTRSHVQHGNMTVSDHSMNVAKYSLAISEKLHIPCEKKDLIRGALLHDYFLYDWHTPDHISPHKLHGFYPGKSASQCTEGIPSHSQGKRYYKKTYVAANNLRSSHVS